MNRELSTDRRGMAIPAVMGILILVVPVVFTLSLRSHSTLLGFSKQQDQMRAALLAEEGEAAALQILRAGGAVTSGSRRVPEGGMEFRIQALAPGALGQAISVLAGEGVFRGEERLVIAVVEIFTISGNRVLIERDRAWVYPGQGGGSLVQLSELVVQHQARIATYNSQLYRECQMSTEQFVNQLQSQSGMLDCPDVSAKWPEIAAALKAAKCRLN